MYFVHQVKGTISGYRIDLATSSIILAFASIIIAWRTLILTKKSFKASEKASEVTKESLDATIESLKLAKDMYLLSSRDFIPNIDFEINEDGLNVINNNSDLFTIEYIDVIGVLETGFEYYNKDSFVLFPLVDLSKSLHIYEDNRDQKEYLIKFSDSTPLSASYPIEKKVRDYILNRIDSEFGFRNENKLGYATPSLTTYYYLIDIGYSNTFNDYKSIAFKRIHRHGIGDYKKIQMSNDEFGAILRRCDLPRDKSQEELWNFLIENYEQEW